VNNTGFAKILKKWDKRSTSSTKEIYLSRQIDIQPCFNKDILTEMSDQINALLQDISKRMKESGEVMSEVSSTNDLSQVDTVIEKVFLSGNEASMSEFLMGFRQNPDAGDVLSRAFMKLVNRGSDTNNLTPLILSGLLDYQTTDEVSGRSILHEAVIAGKLDLVQQCLTHGADPGQLDVFGRSPLHYAATLGFKEGLELFMKRTNVDLPDLDGQRPLLLAIAAGHLECVQVLLDNGSDMNQTQDSYISPLALACRNGKPNIVTLLLKRGAALTTDKESIQPIHIAAREGQTSILSLMIQSGANVNSVDPLNGWTPIMYAASEGHYDAVKLLIDRGCSIDIEDHSGWLPWTYALYKGHLPIANLLEIADYAPKNRYSPAVSVPIKPQGPAEFFRSASEVKDFDLDEMTSQIDLDQIPTLSLPPPMIPFRI
jgi:CDK inhibitor PHO81